jgi:hypothetical protein
LHDPGERDSFGLDEKVNVVGHQNVSINNKAEAPTVVFDSIEISHSVPVVSKDLLAPVAPRNDVVKSPFKFDSRFSGHTDDLVLNESKVQTQA